MENLKTGFKLFTSGNFHVNSNTLMLSHQSFPRFKPAVMFLLSPNMLQSFWASIFELANKFASRIIPVAVVVAEQGILVTQVM
jgi:hypothetical protein